MRYRQRRYRLIMQLFSLATGNYPARRPRHQRNRRRP